MSDKLPFPINITQLLLTSLPKPVTLVGLTVFLVLGLLFFATGAALPAAATTDFEDPIEILGSFLLFTLLIPYLLMCLLASIRANDCTHRQFEHPNSPETQLDRYRFIRWWPAAILIGIAFAVFGNINWPSFTFEPGDPDFLTSIMLVFGQIFMWAIVFLVLFVNSHECWILGRLGKTVPIDLYQIDKLNGFGRAGLNSFLMVVGALAITTVQSIDQEFRAVNYVNGIAVGVPAALIMVSLPIWSLHRRLLDSKAIAIREIDDAIADTKKTVDPEALLALNALLARRDYLKGLRNWPMDLSTFSRLLLYVFIPPLAWVGAALVEFMLDSYLAG